MNPYRVLFVCLGNICRSPAAEGVFKAKVKAAGLEKRIEIDSAGTSGYHNGELPDSRMRQHGKQRGYLFDSRSRKFIAQDFEHFDLIVVMDDSNYRDVLRLATDSEQQKKVHKMVEFLQHHHADHIHDPYYSGAEGFEEVLDLLEDATEGLLNTLINK